MFPSFPEFQELLFYKEPKSKPPHHLAVELCKEGLQHGLLGEELGQATQKRDGAYSYEHLGFMTYRDTNGLGGQKILGIHGG